MATSAAYGEIPLSFEINQGQTDSQVSFLAHGPGYALFLTQQEAVLNLEKIAQPAANDKIGIPSVATAVFSIQLVGANPSTPVVGLDQLPTDSNYFIGNDPANWRINIPNYAEVEYQNVYPGINLVYYGNQGQLEYDWIISPGADLSAISVAIRGAQNTTLDPQGNLILHSSLGDVVEQAPIVYQQVDGIRHPVIGHFIQKENGTIGFQVGAYDKSIPLVIDPVLSYSTYLGGSAEDDGEAIAVDSSGNAYVTGYTASTNFPTAGSPFQGTNGTSQVVAFIAKINSSGSGLLYSTYLGGTGGDQAFGIAVDGSGNAYVAGVTFSNDFPTANPFQGTYGGNGDVFVTKVNASGSALVYSTFLGGSQQDNGTAIAVDTSGDAYVAGYTISTNFPTANAFQPSIASGGASNAFIAKFNSSGSSLLFSTYLGGNRTTQAFGIAIDSTNNVYVTGLTGGNYPTANPLQGTFAGLDDAFVTKFNAAGSALIYSTYLGGSGIDVGNAIAVDSSGDAYVTGSTTSSNFPTVAPFQASNGGGSSFGDAFVAKLNASGSALVYSTYLGGSGEDQGRGIAADSSGNAYVAGATASTNFPTSNAIQAANGGSNDAFMTKLSANGSSLLYSTYLGGNGGDQAQGVAVDGSGNAYVVGFTGSTNFPTANPFQPSTGGGIRDAFVAKISTSTPTSHFVVTAPSTATGVTPFNITVTAEDSGNNVLTNYTGTVHFTSTDGFAGLPTDYPFTATDAGVHIFSITPQTSGSQTFTVTDKSNSSFTGSATVSVSNPVPALTSLGSPNTAMEGSGALVITVNGTNLVPTSVVKWNGSALSTTFVPTSNNTQLTATVPASDFAEEGSFNVTVFNPAPIGGSSGALAFTVTDAALSATGTNFNATEGVSFTGQVATFTDANLKGTISDFTATINWGDGTATSGSTITQPGGVGTIFVVSGTHTYAMHGTDLLTVSISDTGGSPASAAPTATVGIAGLNATGTNISPVEGVSFTGQVATFTDANPTAPLVDFTSTINWGDGTATSSGTVTQPGGVGTTFVVSGTHTYAEKGVHTLAVSITDSDGSGASPTSTATIADAALTATGTNFSAVEGNPFSGQVASFTDANLAAPISDFTATINWGDGTATSSGTVTQPGGVGTTFIVTGTHTYAEKSSSKLSVLISDADGSTGSAAPTATVADAALIASGTTVSAVEGVLFSGQVATFTDANPKAPVPDFTVTINWGDGTAASAGTVTQPAGIGTTFNVAGMHTYADKGSHTLTVSISDGDGSTASATPGATVADAVLTGAGTNISVIEGAVFSGQVASFTDANSKAPISDFTVSITWGDGTAASSGTVSQPGGIGTAFIVRGTHIYAEKGSHTLTVAISDKDGSGTNPSSTATISDAALTATGTPVQETSGVPFTAQVATFTDANPNAPLTDFTTGSGGASINWGDGSPATTGTITQPGGTGTTFIVTGSHTYLISSTRTIHVTITDTDGSTIGATANAGNFRKADIIGRASQAGQWWAGVSNGTTFTNSMWTTWNPNVTWVDVQTGDFTGDGRTDIIGRILQTGQWWVGVSNGTGFTNSLWTTWSPALNWVDVKVGDFTGNGKADIIGRDLGSGQWWVGLSTGSSFTNSLWATWSPAVTWVDVQVSDFTGNGKADIAGRVLQNGQWWVGASTGAALTTSLWTTWNPLVTWVDVSAGDFNGDGKADIAGRFLQTGQWFVAISNGSTGFSSSLWVSWSPAVTWVDVKVGDFNGDGFSDIIGRVSQSGQWWEALSNGSNGFSNQVWATWNPNANWVDVKVGDFNGDGRDDITSRVASSGQWWTALSQGSTEVTSLWATWNPAGNWVDVHTGVLV
jgi:hypothetical protein